jgi:light-harvesting complex I chlorophyll a/b binding protein 1
MVSARALHTAFLSSASGSTSVTPGRAAVRPPWSLPPIPFHMRLNSVSSVHSTDPISRYKKKTIPRTVLCESKQENDLDGMNNRDPDSSFDIETDEIDFLRSELLHLESLEELLNELENYDNDFDMNEEDDDSMIWDEHSLEEILGNLTNGEFVDIETVLVDMSATPTQNLTLIRDALYSDLEEVLLQGVVPVSAGVGSESLPGDFGFDPLQLANRDLFRPAQDFLLRLLPNSQDRFTDHSTAEPSGDASVSAPRPKALVLRDYREAEIRHGRIAMLAAMIWPVQEMVDRYLLSDEQFGPLLYGPVTLPYFPLFMTAMLLLLGYLDIYSQAIKDMDQIGEAFLPGDCFWDPLQILQGAPNRMKRNMQERELFNGRAAMIAVAAYILEEAVTHKALFEIGSNALLLRPVYEIPYIQRWLDDQFSFAPVEPASVPSFDMLDSIDTFVETTMLMLHSQ